MKLFVNEENKRFIGAVIAVLLLFAASGEALLWVYCKELSMAFFILFLLLAACVLTIYVRYLIRQDRIMEHAVHQMEAFLDGHAEARIDCNHEGELYRLFHEINTMAAVLNAHAVNGMKDKAFLKDTISDISHQLKTPLAALNVYNGLLQNEAGDLPEIKAFAELSEQELDRIETLVQNLLKITRLDAGTLEMEKTPQDISDMMKDIGPVWNTKDLFSPERDPSCFPATGIGCWKQSVILSKTPLTTRKRGIPSGLDGNSPRPSFRLKWKIQAAASIRRIYTTFSNGFTGAVSHRIPRALAWAFLWQRQSSKHMTAPLKLKAGWGRARCSVSAS